MLRITGSTTFSLSVPKNDVSGSLAQVASGLKRFKVCCMSSSSLRNSLRASFAGKLSNCLFFTTRLEKPVSFCFSFGGKLIDCVAA
jgi:hypothetical protein